MSFFTSFSGHLLQKFFSVLANFFSLFSNRIRPATPSSLALQVSTARSTRFHQLQLFLSPQKLTMAIEMSIKHGDDAAAKKDFLTAISKYGDALKENPSAFTALIKRAQVYTRLCDYDAAKADISKAFTVAEQRGKMADKATCHFRLGLVNYAEKDYAGSLTNLTRAKELRSTEPALDIWIEKAKRDLKKHAPEEPVEAAHTNEPEKPSQLELLNKQAPIRPKIREEWYQNKTSVTITIYAKGVAKDTLHAEFGKRSVSVSFPTSGGSEYHYNLERLYGEIEPSACSVSVLSVKIELVLVKKVASQWAGLEGEGPTLGEEPVSQAIEPELSSGGLAYPLSSRKKIDWANFDVKDEGDDEGEDFFAKLYKDVDPDTRRAMMKSYVESNGTVLTTNWDEAKQKTFETSPPEGMQAKKWN